MGDALHPDHLQVGDSVGPWRIVEVVAQGGSARVFKVERDGHVYALKMALRPVSHAEEECSEQQKAQEEVVYRRMAREAVALLTYSAHPNLLRVYGVDFWPDPHKGYPFLVMDFVEGDTWHAWRWRTRPHAAALVDVFSEVVRTVGALHQNGVYHRDLKAENLLIRREDGRVFVIDFGTVRLPGAFTKTLGLPEGALHLVPPELIAYTRSEAWKRGEPFQGGAAADLYALGALLYESLTDHHPFDPGLPDETLVTAIATVRPVTPHELNPRAPRSLSDIAMKLLEKRPEDRYPDAETLLQALWKTGPERKSRAWKVPLTAASEDAPVEGLRAEVIPVEQREVTPKDEAVQPPEHELPRETVPRRVRPRWRMGVLVLFGGLGLLALGVLSWRVLLKPVPVAARGVSAPAQKGSPSVPASTPLPSRSALLLVWLCSVSQFGCPAVQVKPPSPEDCPDDAAHAMFRELNVTQGSLLRAIIDVNQPGKNYEMGVYKDGPLVGRLTYGAGTGLPEGTLLYGQLWTGPGIYDEYGKDESVIGRYTKAVLPDGRKVPVCIVLGGIQGRIPKFPGSKPGAVQLPREVPVNAVWRWP
jgi:serine/threonine-protein kinase